MNTEAWEKETPNGHLIIRVAESKDLKEIGKLFAEENGAENARHAIKTYKQDIGKPDFLVAVLEKKVVGFLESCSYGVVGEKYRRLGIGTALHALMIKQLGSGRHATGESEGMMPVLRKLEELGIIEVQRPDFQSHTPQDFFIVPSDAKKVHAKIGAFLEKNGWRKIND